MSRKKISNTDNQQYNKTKYYEDYACDSKEADERYEKNGKQDCYPNIAPALLNSADIKAYVKQTGMIVPFDEKELQSASYKVKIAGKVVYWEYNDLESNKKPRMLSQDRINKRVIDLHEGDGFDLQPNSIAFVTLEPEFRIPKYLALRFNLKIKHIYKGLLLGTGPLVDPGFIGRLSIPLHNLTKNTYHFNYGDTLITMEFTKLSPNKEWLEECVEPGHNEKLKFEEITSDREVDTYIFDALNHDRLNSVISSIPDAIYESKKQAEEANKNVDKVKNNSNIITIGSLIGVFTVVLASITFAMNAFNNSNARYDKIKEEIQGQYSSEIEALNNKINELNERIKELENQETTNV